VIDQGGFYDVGKLFFKNVQDLVCASACAPPGGGRNNVSPRLLRHFHLIWLTNLSADSMNRIFTCILEGFLQHIAPSLAEAASSLVQSSVNIYLRIQKELLPTPLRSHYTFNLRDLSKVFQGVLMVQAKHLHSSDEIVRLWCHEGVYEYVQYTKCAYHFFCDLIRLTVTRFNFNRFYFILFGTIA